MPTMKNLFLLLTTVISVSAFALPEESSLQFKGSLFSYFASHSLTEKNDQIEEAIIVVHGSERNADTYYKSIEAMANRFGKSKSTFIISTHYKLPKDKLLPNELTWTDEGWLSGDPSLSNNAVSSFEIMDNFLFLLGDSQTFPKLKRITVTGHSAGGQLTQRFAVSSLADKVLSKPEFRYIVLNPGSYVYLTKTRPVPVPPNTCLHYNNYKYGLEKLNKYFQNISVEKMIANYLKRDVTYLIGEKDIIADDIDQDCPAVAQGHTRLERGQYYKMQLDQEFPQNNHKFMSVPNVGHTQWGMYTSEIGSHLLFSK
jgi:hypothetical protein